MNPEDDRLQRVRAANESKENLTTEKEKAEEEATKAALRARFERGEIDGARYNKELVALTVPEEKTTTNEKKTKKIVKSSMRQSRIALAASIVSVICAIIIITAKINNYIKPRTYSGGQSALGFIIFPIMFFNLFFIAGMVDSMTISTKEVSEKFANEMKKKKIVYFLMSLSPFVALLINSFY